MLGDKVALKTSGFLSLIVVVGLICFGVWYFFIETLTMTDLVGKELSPQVAIFMSIIDFDTGLTRFDVYRLKHKTFEWEARIRQVESIQDLRMREMEREKLLAEILLDPSAKKISRKVFGFGGQSILFILRAIAGY